LLLSLRYRAAYNQKHKCSFWFVAGAEADEVGGKVKARGPKGEGSEDPDRLDEGVKAHREGCIAVGCDNPPPFGVHALFRGS
jgi:hypothetical protein